MYGEDNDRRFELSAGYLRYIPIDRNWTGVLGGVYAGEGPAGLTQASNRFSVALEHRLSSTYGLVLEVSHWKQKLDLFQGCLLSSGTNDRSERDREGIRGVTVGTSVTGGVTFKAVSSLSWAVASRIVCKEKRTEWDRQYH